VLDESGGLNGSTQYLLEVYLQQVQKPTSSLVWTGCQYYGQGTFVTKGKIIYVQERIGMGLEFLDTPKDQLQILDSWLAELPPAACL